MLKVHSPNQSSPVQFRSGLTYFRLHGSPDIYRSSYDDGRLDSIAPRLRSAANAVAETWCIFDNTTSYAAVGDALALREKP